MEVSVTQAMGEDDLAALGTTGPESEKDVSKNGRQVDVTYELVGLVCLARRPAEEEDDDSPGAGSTRRGPGSSSGIRWRFSS